MSNTEVAYTPTRADELNATGATLFGQGQVEPARLHFLAALSLDSAHAQALQNLGAALRTMGHYAAAEVVAKRSVAVSPENPFCRSNLGVSLLSLKKYDEAVRILRDVTMELPNSAPSWHNYGLALYTVGRVQDALTMFDKSASLAQDNPHLFSDRALALLSLGRVQEGLMEYEVRWKIMARNKIWDLGIPEWEGQDLAGQHVLVHHEQGFGDSIMLSRFINAVAAKARQVTLAMPAELVGLFKLNFPFATVVELNDERLDAAAFDYHTPLLSTMRHLGITCMRDISPKPYLSASTLRGVKLPPGYKVGICWASGDHGAGMIERRRLVPIQLFLPLLEEPGLSLVSLQKGREVEDLRRNGLEGLIFDTGPWMTDFAATASIITELDLVISVDSAVAHLAGALGKRVLMLSPYTRCWRWWGGHDGQPWYDRMSIYDQSVDGTWAKPLQEVVMKARGLRRGER